MINRLHDVRGEPEPQQFERATIGLKSEGMIYVLCVENSEVGGHGGQPAPGQDRL